MTQQSKGPGQDAERGKNDTGTLFQELVDVVARLRDPKTGCPWDLKQTHQSLRRFMLEEAYEAAEVMGQMSEGESSPPKPADEAARELVDELGDVLLQVVLNAQLLTDAGQGDVKQVIRSIRDKMIRRHPHVFAPTEGASLSPEEVKRRWQIIKAEEKGQDPSVKKSVFQEAKDRSFPATLQAAHIGKVAEKIGFDWLQPSQVLEQLEDELHELREEMQAQDIDRSRLLHELGDVYFTLAQLARHLGCDPEVAAQEGNLKFLRRFAKVEALAQSQGIDPEMADPDELEALWQQAKKHEKPG